MSTARDRADAIEAIRSVRLAAHELHNACSTIVGGVAMAISEPTVPVLGQDLSDLQRREPDR